MPKLRVLSWNICKFGGAKLADTNFLEYVSRVIVQADAHVVGLMEVVGWIGNELRDALKKSLSAATKDAWEGYASEMTACRPDEQYIILARSSKATAKPTALPTLNTIAGGDSFDSVFACHKIDADAQVLFWTAMMKCGYIDALFQLSHDAWVKLNQGQLVDLSPAFVMTGAMQKDVTAALARNEPQMFPVRGARPPFFGQFRAQGSSTDVVVLLFHAPGPGSALPVIASNQIPLVVDVQTAKVGVVMGDFNVSASEDTKLTTLQIYDFAAKRLVYVLNNNQHVATFPFQRLTGGPFTNPPSPSGLLATLNYVSAIPKQGGANPPTSLGTFVPAPNVAPGLNELLGVRSSPYDRIFTCGGTSVTASVLDVIDLAIDANKKTTGTTPDAKLQTYAAKAYNTWFDAHSTSSGAGSSSTLQQLLKNCPKVAKKVSTFSEAFYTYRLAVSDHLPVLVEIGFV